ncbi:MAG: cyclic nucleotide-binding domain-containing protein [Gammaproteobacteria bacterium]|jgi:CRP-like cAMP-binding protein|nr:cyclic nucleotide-binding domain-containing protein [Gammaproteobacteria bacterium]MBT5053755.1 cyclic nucleotide-binding domain-containing protein [Gammaproteobacteria bacterium]
MPHIDMTKPASGSRLIQAAGHSVLVGQPPEVLKGLKLSGCEHFDGVLLIDTRERDGSLMNHVEFLLYHFLFNLGGYARGEKLLLIGDIQAIKQAKRLLKITLLGPDPEQFERWGSEPILAKEWLGIAEDAALRSPDQTILTVDDFFTTHTFADDQVQIGDLLIEHTGFDQYRFSDGRESQDLDLGQDTLIRPSYPTQKDYQSAGLSKFSLEVLGGASGFSPNEPCTGLALCHNGDYLLIDAIPFLDEHLLARGISKNQISACFLTHIHDDHCALFPLMQAHRVIDIITTIEIFEMAIEKLALGLGWQDTVIREHFHHIPIDPDHAINHFGLIIKAHHTVHSIPTIGATFTVRDGQQTNQICVVGDNHALKKVQSLHQAGIVRSETLEPLRALYQTRFNLLIADGGAGALHGDPAEFTTSPAERIVFVHIDELPAEFAATFSVASAGKRYNLIDGDLSLYAALIHHYLKIWIGDAGPNRWLRSLVTNAAIKNYNQDDVVLVQGQESKGYVYLILTGYCSVVHHDGHDIKTVATLQAGDLLGEMAALTELGARNASIVALTPVTVCRFSEDAFTALSNDPKLRAQLNKRWQLRPIIKNLTFFKTLNATVKEQISAISELVEYPSGASIILDKDHLYFKVDGALSGDNPLIASSETLGWQPFREAILGEAIAETLVKLLVIRRDDFEMTRRATPQLNYQLRKLTEQQSAEPISWALSI